jgi:hypothetical protein
LVVEGGLLDQLQGGALATVEQAAHGRCVGIDQQLVTLKLGQARLTGVQMGEPLLAILQKQKAV